MMYVTINVSRLIDAINNGDVKPYESKSTGDSYVSATLWVNDEKDEFENIGSLSIFRGDKKTLYFGNIKEAIKKEKSSLELKAKKDEEK